MLCEAPKKFEFITFHVVDDKDIQGKPVLLGVSDSIELGLIRYDKTRVHMGSDKRFTRMTGIAEHLIKSGNDNRSDGNCHMSCNVWESLTEDQFLKRYSEAFTGLGNLGKPVSFLLDPKLQPVHAPVHRISVAK